MESISEGGCEVCGVSAPTSDTGATVEDCDSSRPSVDVWSVSSEASLTSGVSSSSLGCSRDGKASASSCAGTGALLRRFFCDALGGNSESVTESQGSGG